MSHAPIAPVLKEEAKQQNLAVPVSKQIYGVNPMKTVVDFEMMDTNLNKQFSIKSKNSTNSLKKSRLKNLLHKLKSKSKKGTDTTETDGKKF